MRTIIPQSVTATNQVPATDQQRRVARLGRATIEQLHQALAFLLAIDPEAFDIAFTGIADAATEPDEDERAESLCSRCGAPVAISPDFGPDWLHYRGDPAVTGNHEPYDPGHAPQVAWFDLNDMSDEF
jgi:hypothetical protein